MLKAVLYGTDHELERNNFFSPPKTTKKKHAATAKVTRQHERLGGYQLNIPFPGKWLKF